MYLMKPLSIYYLVHDRFKIDYQQMRRLKNTPFFFLAKCQLSVCH